MDVQSLIDGMDGIAYVVDAEGIVRIIGTRHWNAFAVENGGAKLLDGAGGCWARTCSRSSPGIVSAIPTAVSSKASWRATTPRRRC